MVIITVSKTVVLGSNPSAPATETRIYIKRADGRRSELVPAKAGIRTCQKYFCSFFGKNVYWKLVQYVYLTNGYDRR